MTRIWRAKDGDTIDLIALAVYGRTAGAIEALLGANDALILRRGAHLQAGDEVILPVIEEPTRQRARLFG